MRGKWQLGPQNTPQMHISRKLYPALDTWLLYKGWHIFWPLLSGSPPSEPFLASSLSFQLAVYPRVSHTVSNHGWRTLPRKPGDQRLQWPAVLLLLRHHAVTDQLWHGYECLQQHASHDAL